MGRGTCWICGFLVVLASALPSARSDAGTPPFASAGTILYASNVAGASALYAVRTSGGRTYSLGNYDEGRLAANGHVVARSWAGAVDVLRSDGRWRRVARGALRALSVDGAWLVVDQPSAFLVIRPDGRDAWSVSCRGYGYVAPDARTIAFVDAEAGVRLGDARGGCRRVVVGERANATWSPDGSHLAVQVATGTSSSWRIVDVRHRGSRSVRVDGSWSLETWSPNGRRIAFSGAVGESAVVEVLDTRTGTRARFPGPAYAPVWSEDGRYLAYRLYARDNAILIGDVVTGKARVVSRNVFDILWSQHGAQLAFATPGGVEVVAPHGASRTILAGAATLVAWGPDGRSVVFARDGRVGVADVDGRLRGFAQNAVDRPGTVTWSDDGRFAAFVAVGSIYAMTADARRVVRLTRRGDASIVEWRPGPIPKAARPAPPLPRLELVVGSTLQTSGPVADISADGPNVAVLVASDELACVRPLAWRPGRVPIDIGTPARCSGEAPVWPHTILLGGLHMRWSEYSCGNDCYLDTYEADLRRPQIVAPRGETTGDDAPADPVAPEETVQGIHVTVVRGAVHLRRESDGAERVVTAPSARIFDAELEPDGLFYAFNRARGPFIGRVAFLPFPQLFGATP